MGRQARNIGREYHKKNVNVTVSVSSHVPKPHTPFQWCAQDSMDEIARKQDLLVQASKRYGFKLRTHDLRVSHLEGILARGDIRAAELIELAWRGGARFDGWDEHLKWDVWCGALDAWEQRHDVSRHAFLATLPVDGALPWDHIDVGLADGFLAMEYKRTLKGRFSPPCGKPVHAKVHHTNLEDARADERKLVCYHCGVACDLTGMRAERLAFLEQMGAYQGRAPSAERADNARESARVRVERGLAPHDFAQGKPVRYRLRYRKTVPMSLRGHLDMVRVLPRVFRRAKLPLYYSEGFSPRPVLAFGPALALGMQSVAEYVDFSLTEERSEDGVLRELQAASEEGLGFVGIRRLAEGERALGKRIDTVGYAVRLPDGRDRVQLDERLAAFHDATSFPVEIRRKNKPRTVDAKAVVVHAELGAAGETALLWAGAADERVLELRVVESSGSPSLKPTELVHAILGVDVTPNAIVRTGCWSRRGGHDLVDPLERELEAVEA
jgi:radical SAM-linked protein